MQKVVLQSVFAVSAMQVAAMLSLLAIWSSSAEAQSRPECIQNANFDRYISEQLTSILGRYEGVPRASRIDCGSMRRNFQMMRREPFFLSSHCVGDNDEVQTMREHAARDYDEAADAIHRLCD